jgi:hypothetical protein
VSQPPGADEQPSATTHGGLEQVDVLRHEPIALSQTTSHAQDGPHDTPLPQALAAQRALHAPGPHWTPPAHELSPHCTAQLPEAEQSTPLPHEAEPHVTAHAPEPHVSRAGHALSAQVIEHAVELLQSIRPVQLEPPQRTSHVPAPHVIGVGQAFVAEQSISHRDASEQSIAARQLLEPHTIRHGKPLGHRIAERHELLAEQSKTHSLPLHVPGQLASQRGSVPPLPPTPPLSPVPPVPPRSLPSADASGIEESAGPPPAVPASVGDPPPPAKVASTGDAPPVDEPPPAPPGPAPPVTGLASGRPARPPEMTAASGSCAPPPPPDRS